MADDLNIRSMLAEAESRRMRALLDAWQAEIDRASEAAKERRADEARKASERAELVAQELRRQEAAELAAQLIEAAAAEARLYGLVQQAIAGYDISVSVPGGISVASTLINAANDAELEALFAEIHLAGDATTANAQRSAAWAMQHGFVPHPKDLAKLTQPFEPNSAWARHFSGLASQLDSLVAPPNSPALLQASIGGKRLDVVKAVVDALARYSPERTVALVGSPSSVTGMGTASDVPGGKVRVPQMGHEALDRVIRGLFGR